MGVDQFFGIWLSSKFMPMAVYKITAFANCPVLQILEQGLIASLIHMYLLEDFFYIVKSHVYPLSSNKTLKVVKIIKSLTSGWQDRSLLFLMGV